MTNARLIAIDALFMVIYIGIGAALVGILAALAGLHAAGVEFEPMHTAAAVLGVAGLLALPFLPRLYKRLVGLPFSWRTNGVLGGIVEG